MNIKSSASKAWSDLQANKSISIIIFLVSIVSGLAVFGIMNIGGMDDIIKASQAIDEKYSQMAIDQNLTSSQVRELESYKQEKSIINGMWKNWISAGNIFLVLGSFLIIIAFSIYLSCVVLLMSANQAKGKDATIEKNYKPATNYFWRLLGSSLLAGILIFGLIIASIVISVILTLIASLASKLLAGIVAAISVVVAISFIIYVCSRLFFMQPILFLENTGAIECITKSVNVTKHRVREILMAILFIILFSIPVMIISSFSETAAQDPYSATTIIYYTIYYLINAIVSAYIYLFIMRAYLDFSSAKTDRTGTEVADEYMKTVQKKPAKNKVRRK